ncbi:hypothetical protein [Sorangium sp. So ce233]|uniref:hypothetical protein n=1 Tax=Sorangium sp. So ce233 TaxID=3133290 RepID=UPI003F61656E
MLAALVALTGCKREGAASAAARLAPDAPIPDAFPRETRLSIGDPTVQKQLQLSGDIDRLPLVVDWQNISGGPQTVEAFRAGVLDAGAVGIESAGKPLYPGDWAEASALTQETVDLLAEASGQKRFEARTIFDLRFRTIGAEVAGAAQGAAPTDRPATAGRSTP